MTKSRGIGRGKHLRKGKTFDLDEKSDITSSEIEEIKEEVGGQEEEEQVTQAQHDEQDETGFGNNEYNPFGAQKIQREYAQAQVFVSDNDIIPEPVITAPMIDATDVFSDGTEQAEQSQGSNGTSGRGFKEQYSEPSEPEEKREAFNPAFGELSAKQKKKGGAFMADAFIQGYEFLHGMGRNYAKFDEKKMQKKALKGEFDYAILDFELPISETKTISVAEIIEGSNESVDEALVVSDDFKEEIKPLLTEILAEKGWGMTPTQRLLSLVAMDLIPKVTTLIQVKSSLNQIIKFTMEEKAKAKQSTQTVFVPEEPKSRNSSDGIQRAEVIEEREPDERRK